MKKIRNFIILLLIVNAVPVFGYVGPGAGFAFVGSFFFIFIAFFLAFFNFMTFPVRALIKFIKRVKNLKNAKFKRVIIIGFDGMDYNLLTKFMKDNHGDFPNFEKLSRQGTFSPLWSTEPPISPVAWSTFTTGVNPGKHNIFDFLTTDRNTYMPKLAGSDIIPGKRSLKIGKYLIPLSKPKIELMRKSKSFWKIVSSKGIFSSVLRVPFTFPPEKFAGLMLSGLGTPDLRGSQGSFSFYAEKKETEFNVSEGIVDILKKTSESSYEGILKGPPHPFLKEPTPLEIKFKLDVNKAESSAVMRIGKETINLKAGKISSWIKIEFKAGIVKIPGLVQLVLEGTDPVKLYFSPLNIDPESPSMPLSHPKILSVYLSKQLGPFATLGMAEDTSALNERLLSEDAMIDQIYIYQKEREKIFFDTLKKYKNGLFVQVFESTDRIQHMFWRYLEDSGSPADQMSNDKKITKAIYNVYKAMDGFLTQLMPKLKKDDLLMIVSDHGFNAANREFHLNSWLQKEGYLVLKEGKTKSDKWYADVDWSKSRAYGQGLNGLFLNIKGREKYGIVGNGEEAEKLKEEIKQKLLSVVDPVTKKNVIKAAHKREELYQGPYTKNAPDIAIGYTIGFKISWESAVNFVGGEIFSDNKKMWSGDHCFTCSQVPGIFFSNIKFKEKQHRIMDISPTVLSAFGIDIPKFIDGKDLGIIQGEVK